MVAVVERLSLAEVRLIVLNVFLNSSSYLVHELVSKYKSDGSLFIFSDLSVSPLLQKCHVSEQYLNVKMRDNER